jgi:pimeloyl-ACP methyl ester carboxylesterase
MKKWLRRIALAFATLVVAVVVAGVGYEMLGRWRAARDFPPPGALVEIGGRRLHIDCRGSGSPTIVLVSGLDVLGALAWSAVHDSLAVTSRTCAYSRAGIMWSDASPDPVTGKGIADDLRAALANAGEPAPYVMVGHSIGGPYVMTYTRYFGHEVAGLVMVDASHPDQLQRFAAVAPALADLEAGIAPMKIAAALSWAGVSRVIVSRMPRMPNQGEADARAVNAYSSHSIRGALKEMAELDAVLNEAGTLRQLGDRPLFVLSAMKPMSESDLASLELSPAQGAEIRTLWRTLQVDQASWSTRSQHRLVDDASHYIQYDRPDVVIEAVRSVVDSVRALRP